MSSKRSKSAPKPAKRAMTREEVTFRCGRYSSNAAGFHTARKSGSKSANRRREIAFARSAH